MDRPILETHYGEPHVRRPESRAVTAIRLAASVFILLLIALSVMGWVWAGAHQPPDQVLAARTVLGLSALTGAVGLVALWRWRRRT